MAENREINAVLGEALDILPQLEFLQPLRDRLHCGHLVSTLVRPSHETYPIFGSVARRVIRSPRRLRQPVSAGAHWYHPGNWRVCETARRHSEKIGKVYAGRNGIIGALTEDLIDTSVESDAAIAALKHTLDAAFGSCRYKLRSIHEHRAQYERLIEVFHAHASASFSTTAAATRRTQPIKSAKWALGWPIRSHASAFPRQ
jgi:hypothetical protein